MLELGLTTLLSYLIGSLNGSLLLGRILGGPDIRTLGSGNAGGTNALRARGKWFALAVMVVDIGKGFVATAWLPAVFPALAGQEPLVSTALISVCSAGAVIVGHCYPVWFDFAGGKGAATAVGVLMALSPQLLLPGVVMWVIVVAVTGFVGLATMIAAAVLPLFLAFTHPSGNRELLVFLLLLAVFIVYTHRTNIRRLLQRQENRMEKLMIRRPNR
jgi:glycerol-3-phosphate acyltransferase PlsY